MAVNKHKKRISEIQKNAPTNAEMIGSVEFIEAAEGEETTPRISIDAYSGGTLRVKQFKYPVVVELSSAEFEDTEQTYINRHHDQKRELGHSEGADRQISAKGIRIDGVFSHDNEDTRELITASKRGKKFKASIEASFPKAQFVQRGRSVSVNNQTFQGPLFVARNARITGVAVLTRAADMTSNVQIAAQETEPELNMNEDLKQFIEAQGFDAESVAENETQLESLTAMFDASKVDPKPKPVETIETLETLTAAEAKIHADAAVNDVREASSNERKRIASIEKICAACDTDGFGSPTFKAGGETVDLEAHAIDENWTPEQTELKVMKYQLDKKTAGGAAGLKSSKPSDFDSNVIECALAQGIFQVKDDFLEASYSEEVIDKASAKRFQGYSAHAYMEDVIRAAGMDYDGPRKSNDFIRTAFEASNKLQASTGSTSTLALTQIFENVQNKVLLESFRLASTTWQEICGTTSVSDFKKHSRYRMTEDGGFQRLGTDGQINHMGLTESKREINADTWAVMITFTRKMLINDDLGALENPLRRIGQLAALKIEEEVFRMIMANASAFFSAANKNLLTGANSALDLGSLETARNMFRNRVDANGKPTMFAPAILLTGIPLSTTANNLYSQEKMEVTDTSAKAKQLMFSNNQHVGKYRPVSTGYLSNTDIKDQDGKAIPNQSDTAWGLFADPMANGEGVGEVAFLNNQRNPAVERGELDFSRLGVGFRSWFDFGVANGDQETGIWSTGV